MSSRRWVILAVAIVVGLLAGGLVYNYVQGVEDDAEAEQQRVRIFKVAANIPQGTFAEDAFDNGWIVEGDIPAEFRPATAITDESQIAGKVAISDLAANQVVVANQFVDQNVALASFSKLLDQNEVAISFPMGNVGGLTNFIVPGDYVNIMLTDGSGGLGSGGDVTLDEAGNPVEVESGIGLLRPSARFLYQKVQILAIGGQRELQPGQTVATNPDGSPVAPGGGFITVAVPVEAAQWIASSGNFYLTLVSPDYVPQDVAPIAPTPTFPAENPEQRTPYGPEGEQSP